MDLDASRADDGHMSPLSLLCHFTQQHVFSRDRQRLRRFQLGLDVVSHLEDYPLFSLNLRLQTNVSVPQRTVKAG